MSKLAAAGLSSTVAGPAFGLVARAASRRERVRARDGVVHRVAARSMRATPAAASSRPSVRAALADQHGRGRALGRPRRRARRDRRPCRGRRRSAPPAASNARSAAMTASGWVPCESFTKRTPSTMATGSSRCSTPRERRRGRADRRPARPRTAARRRRRPARWTRCGAPGIPSSPIGRMRPPGPVSAVPPPAQRRAADTRSATIQPSTTPSPPGSGSSRR